MGVSCVISVTLLLFLYRPLPDLKGTFCVLKKIRVGPNWYECKFISEMCFCCVYVNMVSIFFRQHLCDCSYLYKTFGLNLASQTFRFTYGFVILCLKNLK